jgi:hypothetical protein
MYGAFQSQNHVMLRPRSNHRHTFTFGPQEGTSRKKDIFDTPETDRWQLGRQDWCDQDPFIDRSEFYHVTTETDSRAEAFVKEAGGGKDGVFVVRRSLSEPAVSVSITYTESGSDEVFHMKVCHPQPRQRKLGLTSPFDSRSSAQPPVTDDGQKLSRISCPLPQPRRQRALKLTLSLSQVRRVEGGAGQHGEKWTCEWGGAEGEGECERDSLEDLLKVTLIASGIRGIPRSST